MRVISQDGTLDVPYEMIVIQRFEEDVYFLNRNLTGVDDLVSDIRLAKYSTEAKATKAMEMLKAHYDLLSFMKLTAGTAKYESFIKKFTEDGFIKATTEHFQFPQDDEIEV